MTIHGGPFVIRIFKIFPNFSSCYDLLSKSASEAYWSLVSPPMMLGRNVHKFRPQMLGLSMNLQRVSRSLHLEASLRRNRSTLPCSRSCISMRSQAYSTQESEVKDTKTPVPTTKTPKSSILGRIMPSAFQSAPQSASSFRKIVALAKPEQRPLLSAIGLLFVSSSVSMSIPFTIGKLIDFFSTVNPVSSSSAVRHYDH